MRFDLITPHASYGELPQRVMVLAHGSLPTTDIYLEERLASLGLPAHYLDTSLGRPVPGDFAKGDFVIIVRYAPLAWLRALAACKPQLAGVVLLLDDDIPAALDSADLPVLYARKMALRYAITRRMMARLCSEVWVSTPYLQSKYEHAHPRLLSPLYLGLSPQAKSRAVTCFYHGTASHRLELEFLVGVVRQVQARLENTHFELIGDQHTRRLFWGIPRVRVLHPMSSPDFLAYTASVQHAVGLAPILDSQFNRARSHVKLYDITRCGAAGVYSDVSVYRTNVQDGVNGILCPNDEHAWVEAICGLLTDEAARTSISRNALAWCEQHAHDPQFRLVDSTGKPPINSFGLAGAGSVLI